jgi:isopentenyl diphosphate isomerase/L-lactate dehydrogenase-like FMN-dependent dehydrogenase
MYSNNDIKSWWSSTRWIRSPFDQVKAISDAVGDKLEIILDGGVRRGTHVLKA